MNGKATRQPLNTVLDRLVRRLRARRLHQYLHAGASVLDVGCGTENWFLRANSSRIRLGIGIDPHLATTTFSEDNVAGFRGTLSEFASLPDAHRFDVVTLLAVIEHFDIDSAEGVLRDCKMMLRPGGTVLLTTPTPRAKPVLEFLAFRAHLISKEEIADHSHYHTERSIRELLKSSGFFSVRYRTFQCGMNSLISASQ